MVLKAELRKRDEDLSGLKKILTKKDEDATEMVEQRVAAVQQEVLAMSR